jgi:hypothetical protein
MQKYKTAFSLACIKLAFPRDFMGTLDKKKRHFVVFSREFFENILGRKLTISGLLPSEILTQPGKSLS